VVRNVFDHPVCASKVCFAAFLDRAATPPLEEGNTRHPRPFSSRLGNTNTRPPGEEPFLSIRTSQH